MAFDVLTTASMIWCRPVCQQTAGLSAVCHGTQRVHLQAVEFFGLVLESIPRYLEFNQLSFDSQVSLDSLSA